MFFTIWPKDNWIKCIARAVIFGFFVQSTFAATITQYVDSRLQPYYDDYMFITKTHCRPDQYLSTDNYFISVEDIVQDPGYKEGDPRTVGTCDDIPPYKYTIRIDTQLYNESSPIKLKYVIFHEFRHCIFGKDNKDHSKDPMNYFAKTVPDILDDGILYKQVIDDIKKSCGSP